MWLRNAAAVLLCANPAVTWTHAQRSGNEIIQEDSSEAKALANQRLRGNGPSQSVKESDQARGPEPVVPGGNEFDAVFGPNARYIETLAGSRPDPDGTPAGATEVEEDGPSGERKFVYIIRHGEKAGDPSGAKYHYACLSRTGRNRADHLVDVFLGDEADGNGSSGLVVPSALFAYDYDDGDLDCRDKNGAYRTGATIRPLADALGLTVVGRGYGSKSDLCGLAEDEPPCHPLVSKFIHVHDFGPCCNSHAAEAILSALFDGGGSVLVAWEHANINFLVEALAEDGCGGEAEELPPWPDEEFDAIYAVGFDPRTRKCVGIDTTSFHQGFNLTFVGTLQ